VRQGRNFDTTARLRPALNDDATFVRACDLLYGVALRGRRPGDSLPVPLKVRSSKEHVAEFFNEVDEELRTERLMRLAQRGWPYFAGALVLAVLITLGVVGYSQHNQSEQAKASNAYDLALQSLATGDLDTADQRFAGLAASAPAGYRTLALMQEAGVRVQRDKPDEAVRFLDQAAKAAPDDILGDAARLKAALLLIDTHPLAEVQARLAPLIDDKRPYHLMAREARAMALLRAGRPQDAQSDLAVLSLSQDVSQESRQQAEVAKMLIQTGAAAVLPAAANAAPAAIPQAPSQLPLMPNAGAPE
jgi:hypothetical protein